MPNGLAYLVLLLWPLVAAAIFRKLPIERAVIWSILIGYLLLPPRTAFDAPMVPPLDKHAISNLSAFLCATLMMRHKVSLMPESRVAQGLLLLLMLSPIATVMTNGDPIWFEVGGLPAVRPYDLVSVTINQALTMLPFLLGRQLLATPEAHRDFLVALVVAALFYSLPMLVEIRLSPQINVWVYGFFQHDFIQMMRQGGFRPIVFLSHGLMVAFFAMTALLAAVALWRIEAAGLKGRWMLAAGYLAVILVLCKSMAVLIYALLLIPVLLVCGVRTQVRLAAVLAAFAMLYPMLRGADLVPVDAMVEQAAARSAERAQSLEYRMHNEDQLLAHARERPWFGWGPWGRNLIYDVTTGKSDSVTDGTWIIVIGIFGWAGYVAQFGLLTLPLLLLPLRIRRGPPGAAGLYAGPMALILGINMIDLLPNSSLTPLTWLMTGAMLGYVEALARGQSWDGVASLPVAPAPPRTVM